MFVVVVLVRVVQVTVMQVVHVVTVRYRFVTALLAVFVTAMVFGFDVTVLGMFVVVVTVFVVQVTVVEVVHVILTLDLRVPAFFAVAVVGVSFSHFMFFVHESSSFLIEWFQGFVALPMSPACRQSYVLGHIFARKIPTPPPRFFANPRPVLTNLSAAPLDQDVVLLLHLST